jgi:methylenetetrahydrofolate dehydrogenase (NADP+) / methenyltetrahydrofolate cyclohydrolase
LTGPGEARSIPVAMTLDEAAPATVKLRGDALAKAVKQAVAEAAERLKAEGITPKMAVILASEDPASVTYAEAKKKAAAGLGIEVEIHNLGAGTTQEQLLECCSALSADAGVHGILLELPLAAGLSSDAALDRIAPGKDIDGLTAYNLGLIAAGREEEALTSATAQACIVLAETQGPLAGKRVALIGRGRTVGRPLMGMLINRHATVTVCHTRTRDLKGAIADCDIVMVAIGKARQVTGGQLRAGQTVIDAGINYLNGKLVGDVDAESVEGVAAALTPVPGGVGPLTSSLIFQNLIRAAERSRA